MAFAIPVGILVLLVVLLLLTPWVAALGVVAAVIVVALALVFGLRFRRDTRRTIRDTELDRPTKQPDAAETELLGAHHPGAPTSNDDAQG
jgi:membrane protein implicated in regulation of membrane protease activity